MEAIWKRALHDEHVIILDRLRQNLDVCAFSTARARHTPARLNHVIITSAASPAVINERLKGIEFDLLPKPFDINELISRVRACARRVHQ